MRDKRDDDEFPCLCGVKEAWLTGLAGVWFLASPRAPATGVPLQQTHARRPAALARRLGRPLGTLTAVPAHVARVQRALRRRHAADAALRVVLAHALPVDEVPGLATALYAVTSAVLLVVTNVYYVAARSPEWWPHR